MALLDADEYDAHIPMTLGLPLSTCLVLGFNPDFRSTQLNSTQLNWPRDLDGKT